MAKVDFRFLELEHELHLLGGYIDMLDVHLPTIVQTERERLYTLFENVPIDERPGLDFLEADLDDGVPTRAFVACAIVGMWALYETSVIAVAQAVRQRAGAQLELNDLRGDFLHRARSYFDDVLRFKLYADQRSATRLHHLSTIRNAFAHTGGRIDRISELKLKRLQAVIEASPGISRVDDRYLVATTEGARYFHGIVAEALDDLFRRARA